MTLSDVLQKEEKSLEDAHLIFEKIRHLKFFDAFFAQNFKTVDFDSVLTFCQSFQYQSLPIGKFALRKEDSPNDKFYIILSGQVSVIVPHDEDKNSSEIVSTLKLPVQKEAEDSNVEGQKDASPGSKTKVNDTVFGNIRINLDESPNSRKGSEVKFAMLSETTPKSSISRFNLEISRKESEGKATMLPSEVSPKSKVILLRSNTATSLDQENPPALAGKQFLRRFGAICKTLSAMRPKPQAKQENLPEEQGGVLKISKLNLKPVPEVEEPEVVYELNDPRKFEEYASKFGQIVKSMYKGECFGDLGLDNVAATTTSILCRTGCEFLVGTKQQMRDFFQKRNDEKEMFFKNTFPFLNNLIVAKATFKNFLGAFRTETYSKGAYLTIEGKINEKEPKLFVIYMGECLVEKAMVFDTGVNNSISMDKSQIMGKSTLPINIAVVGKGMVVGEEILLNGNEYSYSVKALSETVKVHAITKGDIKRKCIKEFRDHILAIYKLRRKQRETIFQNIKKEFDFKTEMHKNDKAYTGRTSPKHFITKPTSIHGLNHYLHQEEIEHVDPVSPKSFVVSPKASPIQRKVSISPARSREGSEESDGEISPTKVIKSLKDRPVTVKNIDMLSPKEKSIESKFEFLSRIPDLPKKTKDYAEVKDLDELRLFSDRDSKKNKCVKDNRKKISVSPTPILSPQADRPGSAHVEVILKGLSQTKKRLKFLSQETEALKQIQKVEDKNSLIDESLKLSPAVSLSGCSPNKSYVEKRKGVQNSSLLFTGDSPIKRPTTATTTSVVSTYRIRTDYSLKKSPSPTKKEIPPEVSTPKSQSISFAKLGLSQTIDMSNKTKVKAKEKSQTTIFNTEGMEGEKFSQSAVIPKNAGFFINMPPGSPTVVFRNAFMSRHQRVRTQVKPTSPKMMKTPEGSARVVKQFQKNSDTTKPSTKDVLLSNFFGIDMKNRK